MWQSLGEAMAKAKKQAKPARTSARATTEVDAHIGLTIRTKRIEERMSQERLAEIIGVTFQQVQKYEKGVNRVAAPTLIKIAGALQCQPGDLLPKSDVFTKTAAPGEAAFNLELAATLAVLNGEGRKALLKIAKSFARDPEYSTKKRD